MKTTVVIVNWNGARFLPVLLESLESAKTAEIIAIDNASSDDSVDFLRGQSHVRTIENSENVGYGNAANQGIEISNTAYVLILNVDTRALSGSVEKLEEFLDKNPKTGLVAPQLLFPDGELQTSCRKFPGVWNQFFFLSYLDRLIPTGYRISKRKHNQAMQVDQPMGAVLMIRKSALDAVGSFDPQFSLYMEEVDLCKRMKERDWQISYLPEAKFIHHAGGSSGQDWERSQREYLKNLIRYFEKHFPEKKVRTFRRLFPIALLIRSFVLLLAGRVRQSRFYFNQIFKEL
jgi:GT2 family glycosyltransferase